MDPVETVLALLVALAGNERAEAQDHADALADWLSKDGFTPKIDQAFVGKLLERLPVEPKKPPLHVVVQKGGTSSEWYASSYDSRKQAIAAAVGHFEASYSAIGPYVIPNPPAEEDWLQLLGEVAGDAATDATSDYDTLKTELETDG